MPYEQASALAREGRFADALAALSAVEARHDNPVVQTLRAELLEHTGAYAEAGRLADAIRRSRQGDRALVSRCEVVVGHIAQTKGRIEEAREHYRQAIALATAAGDLRQLCWGQLYLLYSMRTQLEQAEVRSLLSDARRNTTVEFWIKAYVKNIPTTIVETKAIKPRCGTACTRSLG